MRVTILGLGLMGEGIARRLLSRNFAVTVYNRSRPKAETLAAEGARAASSPREAASGARVVISMVADDAASRAVWLGEDGALAGAAPGTILIEASTLTPAWVRELAAAAVQRKCALLDAPVLGSRPQAAHGELVFLVGGAPEALESARRVLEPLSRDIVYLGPSGGGAVMKLVNNFLCGVQVASFAEGMALAEASGLDRELAAKVLGNGAPGSPLVKTIWARAAEGSSDPYFYLRLMEKDLRYANEESRARGLALRMSAPAIALFEKAVAEGYGDRDFSALIEACRPPRDAGVPSESGAPSRAMGRAEAGAEGSARARGRD